MLLVINNPPQLSAGGYTAAGSLSFLPDWRAVLTNPSRQIAMLSPTGVKEAQDMGYQLRTKYSNLYSDHDDFVVWANNYTRVLQTAEMFVRGYLGWEASTRGSVVAVTGKGFPGGIGDSLAPSDMCPNFKDTEGSDKKNEWDIIWITPVLQRLQSLISGNLTLTVDDVLSMPYLCGFESQITGRLSPWCDVLTDDELQSYQYSNDMRYFYGIGPGTDLNKKMMTPFLNALVGLFQKGAGGVNGTRADGSSFRLPRLLASFLNDGQLTELVTASGVFDEQPMLSTTSRDDSRLWIGSRYVTMRGTIAFERLNCRVTPGATRRKCKPRPTTTSSSVTSTPTDAPGQNATYIRILLNDAVYPVPSCQNGPGSSCLLDDYAKYVADKYEAEGDWIENCNVSMEGTPSKVKGASFFTDLGSPWVQTVKLG